MATTPPPFPNRRNRRSKDPATQPRWVSLQQAADHLGIQKSTLRSWIAQGKLTGYRINARVIRVDLNEVDASLQPFGGGVS